MKKISYFLFLFISVAVSAQPVLTYQNHALKTDVNNPMTICSYAQGGESGTNVKWDFTNLKALKEITGHVTDASNENFSLANTELEESGVKFFFNTSESGMEMYGYLSQNGRVRVNYDTPFEKIRYPFAFRDAYTAPFSGEYFSNDISIGQIEGNSIVEADGWGTISLPGNVSYENTLRVRSERNYTLSFEKSKQSVSIVTYRWYNSAHRYPLLVLIDVTTDNGSGPTKSNQAAYNLNAVTEKNSSFANNSESVSQGLSLYPNPASDEFTLGFISDVEGLVSISITDMLGREILPAFDAEVIEGSNEILLKDKISFLQEGLYVVRVNNNGKVLTHELSISK